MKSIPRFSPPLDFSTLLRATSVPRKFAGRAFEKRFAEFLGVKHTILAPSGRAALGSILAAIDLPEGSEVLLPALTFHSVPRAVLEARLHPTYLDVGKTTYCIDPDLIEQAITRKTRAIIPTHLYGRACDMDAIRKIAERHGLFVIEDCAQSCGGKYGDHRLGSIGGASFFSLGPTKNLSALWAGMIAVHSDELAAKVRTAIQQFNPLSRLTLARRVAFSGAMRIATRPLVWRTFVSTALSPFIRKGKDPIESATTEAPVEIPSADDPGFRMPLPLQAAVGLTGIAKLDAQNQRRIRNGERLLQELQDTQGLDLPASSPTGENIFMSFPVQVENRADFKRRLFKLGVDTAFGYMTAGKALPGFEEHSSPAPNAEAAIERMVHLPVYPELSDDDIDRIAEAVKSTLSK
jgi:dTDP-4-amino-4,6-dideoxygalactose transaminase